jgi:cytidylate kinase
MDRGEAVSMEEVEAELRKRDEQDKNRQIAPLRPAEDAIIIDTTPLGVDQVIVKILEYMREGEFRLS